MKFKVLTNINFLINFPNLEVNFSLTSKMRTKGQMMHNSKLVNQRVFYKMYYIVGNNTAVVNL